MTDQTPTDKILTLLNSGWTVEDLRAVPRLRTLLNEAAKQEPALRELVERAGDAS